MKFKFLMVLLMLLIIPTISAQQTTGPFIIDNPATLEQVCDNCTFINLTKVTLPNSTIIIFNSAMTKTGTIYNFSFTNTDTLGDYIYTTCGDPNGVFTCQNVEFTVTRTGQILSTAESIIYIIFLVGSIFALCFTLFFAITLPFKDTVNPENGLVVSVNDLKYLKVLAIAASYVFLLFITGILRSITSNYLFINGASNIFNWSYWILFSFLWPTMVVALLFTFIMFIESKKIKTALERGVPFR